MGGHFMFDDDQETPNTLNCAFEFNENGKRKMMEFEVRHWMTNGEATVARARQSTPSATCSTGRRATWRSTATHPTRRGWAKSRTPGPEADEGGDHYPNFIEAVRSRKREHLNAEIEEGATRPCWCTWRTSPIAWAGRCTSMQRP